MSSPAPWNDARAIIEADGLAGAPVRWPAEPWTLPNPPVLWVAVDMAGDVTEPIEMGPGGGWQETGALYATVFIPQGFGTANARVLAQRIINLFRNRPTGVVTYSRASIGNAEPDTDDGAWWRLLVTVDYRYQDIVS